MEVNQHVILDSPYQGDGIWIVFVVFSLFLLFFPLLAARRRRNAGQPVDVRELIAGCLISRLLRSRHLSTVDASLKLSLRVCPHTTLMSCNTPPGRNTSTAE